MQEVPDAVRAEPAGQGRKERKKRGRRKLWWLLIPLAVIILLIVLGFRACQNAVSSLSALEQVTAERRDITVTVNAASVIKPLDSYTVISFVNGDVLEADFKEGDVIGKGDVLYRIDSSDMESAIRQSEEAVKSCELGVQQAELSVSAARRALDDMRDVYDDLMPESGIAGRVVKIYYEKGDSVTAGMPVCDIADRDTAVLVIPFHSQAADGISVGDAALVSVSGETLTGTVSKVSGAQNAGAGGILTREVEISVANPGGITAGMSATASVGDNACAAPGAFKFNRQSTVYAAASGDVAEVLASEGDAVVPGTPILRIDSSALDSQLAAAEDGVRNAELAYANAVNSLAGARSNLQDMRDRLDDYVITSPIAGTVVEKNFKVGDKLDATTSSKAMAVIYDLSALEAVLDVDERDIPDMTVGSTAVITADALGSKEFTGRVARIGINGTAIGGVTSYPVTIRIDDTEGLLPGMNITADIVTVEVKDVLAIPTSAVSRGNTVLLYDETSAGDLADRVPAGYRRIAVELGRSDDDYIEVLSGLEEGDVLGISTSVTTIMEYYMDNAPGMSDGGMMGQMS